MNAKTWLVLGAWLGGLAVALGAFGAHGLPWYFEQLDRADALLTKALANWEIAARYHMYHALAMVAVGVLADRKRHWLLDAAGICFFFGILIFSGCLYALALTDVKRLGAIVPIGGVLYIVGWLLLALAANQFVPIAARASKALAAGGETAGREAEKEVPWEEPQDGDEPTPS